MAELIIRHCDVKIGVNCTFLSKSLQSNDIYKQSFKMQTGKGLRTLGREGSVNQARNPGVIFDFSLFLASTANK